VVAEVEQGDDDEEERGNLKCEGCPEKIAGHWEFCDSIHGSQFKIFPFDAMLH